jgi:hypothetical protein
MYRVLRDTHLLLGLFLFVFVMMFGVSSLEFSHRSWFGSEPTDSTSTVVVDPGRTSTPRELARHLMEEQGYGGGLHDIRAAEGQILFNISRIGTVHDVRYTRGAREAQVRTRVFPFMSMMTWMHGTFGMHHEYAPHNVWGALMFLTSVGLLVLGGTGLYLWFKLRAERRIGLILLFGNLVFGATLIVLLWVG